MFVKKGSSQEGENILGIEMDELKIQIDSMGYSSNLKNSFSDSMRTYRKNESVQVNRNASINSLQQSNGHKPETVKAISKWITSGNLRLEFYPSVNNAEIRVRIVPNDCSEAIRDLSLDEFLNMAPICV